MHETITRPTVMDRIRVRADRRSTKTDDQGLALLDVLLGMAIFALIVIIAIQAIGQFRQRAYQTAANSDAQQLSVALESYVTDNQALPPVAGTAPATYPNTGAAATTKVQSDVGVNLTKNTEIHRYGITSAVAGTYTYCILHKTGSTVDAWAFYESSKGAITQTGRGTPAAFNASTSPCGA